MVCCVVKKAIENVSAMVTIRDPFLDFIDADDTKGTWQMDFLKSLERQELQ